MTRIQGKPGRYRSCLSGVGLLTSILIILAIVVGYFLFQRFGAGARRSARLLDWLYNPSGRLEWTIQAGVRCGNAPFLLPTNGMVGYLWGDSFRMGHLHQGIDVFGGEGLNTTPVYAAYPGYLRRLTDWKSSVIIRIPDDPLHPGRQIWTYYTHLAGPLGESYILPDFPPGSSEIFVEAGTLLGRQGNYSGYSGNPVGVHLHFSIVLDDGQGSFRNELEFSNTLDPSPYLGLALNASSNPDTVPVCQLR